ncbi:hypothetical protein A0J61_10346, partial [Choanephora cucurbitarum]
SYSFVVFGRLNDNYDNNDTSKILTGSISCSFTQDCISRYCDWFSDYANIDGFSERLETQSQALDYLIRVNHWKVRQRNTRNLDRLV